VFGQEGRDRAIREGVRVALADCEAIFRAREMNKHTRDQAARVCRALCRTRVIAEMHQRRGTRIAEHLKMVLSTGALSLPEHRFPPPWSVEETDPCFIEKPPRFGASNGRMEYVVAAIG
jgi:hypothetical protein